MKIIKNQKNNYEFKKLKDILKINLGQSPSSESYVSSDLGLPFYQGVAEFGDKYPTPKIYTNATKKNANKDEILMTVRAPVGRINIAKEKCSIGRGLCSLSSENNLYIYYSLNEYKNKWKLFVQGSIFEAVNKKDIENFKIPYAPKEEQKKIVKLLSEKEKHIENIKSLISKLEKRNEYYAENFLSGELRVRENEKGEIEFYENTEWKEVKLNGKLQKIPVDWNKQLIKDIIKLQKGTSISSENLNYENGIQYLRTNEIWQESSKNKEEIYYNGDMSKIVTKNENEFIICFDGYNNKPHEGTVGMVTSNGSGICSGELHKIQEIDKVSKYYVNVMLLKNKRFQKLICRYAEGSTVRHAGKHLKKIEEFLIPYCEQILLNEIFSKNINEIKNLRNLIKKETKEFEWLSEKLLSGVYIIED